MRHRRYSYSRKQTGRARYQPHEPGLVETALEALADLVKLVVGGIGWWWNRDRPISTALPPPLPGRITSPPTTALAPVKVDPLPRSVTGTPLPYRRATSLLTRGERALWYPLYRAVRGKYRIFTKVRLADVVVAPRGRGERYWFRKIGRYHVDFVICDPQTTGPLLVIELDDRSHRTERAQQRDAFKNDVLRAAGVPIYRVPAQPAYDPLELAAEIDRLISSSNSTPASAPGAHQ